MSIGKELLMALVRHAVTLLIGILVAHGVIDAQQAGHFTTELTVVIVTGIIGLLATYGASAWNKLTANNRFLTALALPANTTPTAAVNIADSKSLAVKLSTATSPGDIPVPKDSL